MKRLCVFCGAKLGRQPDYRSAAHDLGALLAERGLGLVYGGGRVGLMGALADSVLEHGGEVIGVIPKALAKKEVLHDAITEVRVVGSMHERKALMAGLADAFVALPGGFGTLEELLEIVTWLQLGIVSKPVGVLDVLGYYQPLLRLLDHAVSEGFIAPRHRALLVSGQRPNELLSALASILPVAERRWLSPGEA